SVEEINAALDARDEMGDDAGDLLLALKSVETALRMPTDPYDRLIAHVGDLRDVVGRLREVR
ncbi:MAG: hypothetical protein JSS20_10765, partial [Proteobacteria bacterium]|nr:hypothetical protein [Pseudomonadota bacterium]